MSKHFEVVSFSIMMVKSSYILAPVCFNDQPWHLLRNCANLTIALDPVGSARSYLCGLPSLVLGLQKVFKNCFVILKGL